MPGRKLNIEALLRGGFTETELVYLRTQPTFSALLPRVGTIDDFEKFCELSQKLLDGRIDFAQDRPKA